MSARDKDEAIINPFTGQLDMVRSFNADRIVTHSLNQAGYPLVVFDMVSGQYLPAGPSIVTDEKGNVVVT